MNTNTDQTKNVNLNDINAQQSLEVIWTLLNKANSKGVFTLDEAYATKVLFDKVAGGLGVQQNQPTKTVQEL